MNDWQDFGVEPNAAATRWCGERMDYDLGVWVPSNQAIRARSTKDTATDTLAHVTHEPAANSLDDVAAATSRMPEEPYEPWWKRSCAS